MKIKWILRLKNKPVLAALIAAGVAFVYRLIAILGITPSVSESAVTETAGLFINLLVALGIVVDPTTEGIADSDQAMAYTVPKIEMQTEADEDEAEETEVE